MPSIILGTETKIINDRFSSQKYRNGAEILAILRNQKLCSVPKVIFLRTTATSFFKLPCNKDDSLQWKQGKPTLPELSYKMKVEPQHKLILSLRSQKHTVWLLRLQFKNIKVQNFEQTSFNPVWEH